MMTGLFGMKTMEVESFTTHTITTGADGADSVVTADIDSDGDLDVLYAAFNSNGIVWQENDGSENFTPHIIAIFAVTAGFVSAIATDVDGDGDVDLLSATVNNDTITWYENDGNQSFTAHIITSSADGVVSIATADVDDDGDLDVLSADHLGDRVAWYENDGSENFTPHTIATVNAVGSVAVADFDGDGDLDALSTVLPANDIAWYENDGSENFTAHTIDNNALGVQWVATADLDGDGDLDVASAASRGDGLVNDRFAWYEHITDFGPAVESVTYYATAGILAVSRSSSGTGLVSLAGTTNDIDASLLTFTGQGSATYTLTDTPDVELIDENSFSLTLSATDKAAVNALLNNPGIVASDGTVYNLSLAAGFNGVGSVLDATNPISTNFNSAPTDLQIDGANTDSVNENRLVGAVVGTLTSTDSDTVDQHTYTLVTGTGDTDNASFSIDGDILLTAAVFDFETQNSYSIRVRTTDTASQTYEEALIITINDIGVESSTTTTTVWNLNTPGSYTPFSNCCT